MIKQANKRYNCTIMCTFEKLLRETYYELIKLKIDSKISDKNNGLKSLRFNLGRRIV